MNDLTELIMIVSIVVGVVLFAVLFSRTSALRKELEEIKATHLPHAARAEHKQPAQTHEVHRRAKSEPGSFELLIQWLRKDWLMKLGALFVLLAIVWFVRYAFINDWIGEMGRVAIGLVVGAGILIGGYFQIHKRPVPGQVLLVLGTTAILFTVFIARNSYDLFTPLTALAIMAFVVVLIASVAVMNKSLAVAVTAFLGGLAAPMLTNDPNANILFLNSYLFLLNCGVFVMVALRGWRVLLLLALIATGIYIESVGTFSGAIADSLVWLFMGLFYGLFFIGTSSAILHSKKVNLSDIATIVITVLLGIFWVAEYVPVEWQSMVLAVAVVFAGIVNFISLQIGAPKISTYLTGLAAIGLLGAATAFELEGAALTIALSLEVSAVVSIIRYVIDDHKAALTTSLLQVVPIMLAISSLQKWRGVTLFNEDFFVLLIVGISLVATALMIQSLSVHTQDEQKKKTISGITIFHSVASGILLLAIIWRGLEVIMNTSSAAHGTALVIYTVIALIFFFGGLLTEKKTIKLLGHIALILVILRLSFVEIWDMDLIARTITFVIIGILLITTAFFQKKSSHNK
jgi:hypothetical protein